MCVSKEHLDSNCILVGLKSRGLTFSITATYKSDTNKLDIGIQIHAMEKFISYLYFTDFWCRVITISYHYCSVPPTEKMVEQNNVLIYHLPVNCETIEGSNYNHYFKCSPGKLWGMGRTRQSMAIKHWKLIKCDLWGFIFLCSTQILENINCNAEQEYGECIRESQDYFSNWWQAN